MARVGVSIRYLRAAFPTTGSSFSSSATTEGTRREPSSPGITTGVSPFMKATREFVVPRSMPTTGAFFSSLISNPSFRSLVSVLLGTHEVKRDIRLIADDPAIVAGRDVKDIASFHFDLAAIAHRSNRSAGDNDSDVFHVATLL